MQKRILYIERNHSSTKVIRSFIEINEQKNFKDNYYSILLISLFVLLERITRKTIKRRKKNKTVYLFFSSLLSSFDCCCCSDEDESLDEDEDDCEPSRSDCI